MQVIFVLSTERWRHLILLQPISIPVLLRTSDNKAFHVCCGFWQIWKGLESSLGEMDTDVNNSSLKMCEGNIPFTTSLVIFRYNPVLFFSTNYTHLSPGKASDCECITCFRNHLFINEMVPWCLGRFRLGCMRLSSIWNTLTHLSHLSF